MIVETSNCNRISDIDCLHDAMSMKCILVVHKLQVKTIII
jgi:hypothetical protein